MDINKIITRAIVLVQIMRICVSLERICVIKFINKIVFYEYDRTVGSYDIAPNSKINIFAPNKFLEIISGTEKSEDKKKQDYPIVIIEEPDQETNTSPESNSKYQLVSYDPSSFKGKMSELKQD